MSDTTKKKAAVGLVAALVTVLTVLGGELPWASNDRSQFTNIAERLARLEVSQQTLAEEIRRLRDALERQDGPDRRRR